MDSRIFLRQLAQISTDFIRMEDTRMDGRDWKKFLLPYEQAIEELKVKFKTLRGELKKPGRICTY